MSLENVFLNRINELNGLGLSDVLLWCVDVMEEHDLVIGTAESTALILLSFREKAGKKFSAQYKKGYAEGTKARLLGRPIIAMPYTFINNEQAFWGWFDGWVDI